MPAERPEPEKLKPFTPEQKTTAFAELRDWIDQGHVTLPTEPEPDPPGCPSARRGRPKSIRTRCDTP